MLFAAIDLLLRAAPPPQYTAVSIAGLRSRKQFEENPISVPWSPVPTDTTGVFTEADIGYFRIAFQVNHRLRRTCDALSVSNSKTPFRT